MPRVTRDILRRGKRVGRSAPAGGRRRLEQLVATARRPDAGRQQDAQRVELGQGGRLRAVQRVLNHRTQPARLQVDQIRHVSRGDPQSQCVAAQRSAVQELRCRPRGGYGREFVDRHALRGRGVQRGHQRDRGIQSIGGSRLRHAALGDEVAHADTTVSSGNPQGEASVVLRPRLAKLPWGTRPCQPQRHVGSRDGRAASLHPSFDARLGKDRDGHERKRKKQNGTLRCPLNDVIHRSPRRTIPSAARGAPAIIHSSRAPLCRRLTLALPNV